MLRVYAGAHGLTSTQHAVVEVGGDEIVLRVGPKWMRFSRDEMKSSQGASLPFSLEEDGRVRIGDAEDEMDMAAERVAREMLAG
jgi:hypothetical protein